MACMCCGTVTLSLCSYMTCVRTNTGWKYCLIGVLGSMGLAILKASSAALCK